MTDNLIRKLGIPLDLIDGKDTSLFFAYRRYKACLEAIKTLEGMISDKTWTGKRPTSTDIVGLFVSKSMWYSHYRTTFPKLPQGSLMFKWLDGGDDKPTDLDVWGYEKLNYQFKDLLDFVENGGPVSRHGSDRGEGSRKKGKEKRKAVDDGNRRKKEKKVEGTRIRKRSGL
jgi:hypothetical protein